ncbi:hypothetical protein EYC84_005672 [Monilinia fructicola]|uniref:Uncharacterized protein n=1 Tax=Monilinia fructicola TaxID=38448 RepID=A0A5M9JZS5_MONFR|nr:hypothetical protein EYC84_005672 [Monilinia fructicola]
MAASFLAAEGIKGLATLSAADVAGAMILPMVLLAYAAMANAPASNGKVLKLAPRNDAGLMEVESTRNTGLGQSTFLRSPGQSTKWK